MSFIKQFLTNPFTTWAIAPSSQALASYMIECARLKNKNNIVEYGPWSWVFTKEIIKQKNKESTFFSIELNAYFYQQTKENCPNAIVYNDNIIHLPKYLERHNISQCDCIISWLPWASFKKKDQESLMEVTYNSLQNKWLFLTFSYIQSPIMGTWKVFEVLLRDKFKHVLKSRIIWKNLPPAFVYICEK